MKIGDLVKFKEHYYDPTKRPWGFPNLEDTEYFTPTQTKTILVIDTYKGFSGLTVGVCLVELVNGNFLIANLSSIRLEPL
jgi:hypothetical protein